MTHDELLLDVSEVCNWYEDQERFTEVVPYLLALRAVVELHKPDSTEGCNACEQWTNEGAYQLFYPCPTIQAIEKELA